MAYRIAETKVFRRWLEGLKDLGARARIVIRLQRASLGHLGDSRSLGRGLRELRVHSGPGYRIYFVTRGPDLLVVLCGGEKSTQERDFALAHRLLESDDA